MNKLIEGLLPPEPEAEPGENGLAACSWPQEGMLKNMGYKVGSTNGKPESDRQQSLNQIFYEPIPSVDSPEYMAQWGRNESVQRFKKLVWTIATLANNRCRKIGGRDDVAVLQWKTDLK
jgi:hypothetical protein